MENRYYHTQEKRTHKLSKPIISNNVNAWLGQGYYFWVDLEEAHKWGLNSKRYTGYYEIYLAEIDTSDILDTVFNEEHYTRWVKIIEKTAKAFFIRTGRKPRIKEINEYLFLKGFQNRISGVLFQDLPTNQNYLLVEQFYYKKRIQLVVYKIDIIQSFNFITEGVC